MSVFTQLRSYLRLKCAQVFPSVRLGRTKDKRKVYKEERKEENVVVNCEKRARGEEAPVSVEALLSCRAAGAESGWSAGECWLQVKLSFPARIVCGPSTRGETAAQSSAGR